MTKFFVTLICGMLFFCNQLCATSVCVTIDRFRPVLDKIEQLHKMGEKDVMVVLDLDETIIVPIDPCLHIGHSKMFKEKLNLFSNLFKDSRSVDALMDEIIIQMLYNITDPLIPQIIKKIKEYGFKAIIISACRAGCIGRANKKVEDVRLDHLNYVLNGGGSSEKVKFGPYFTNCSNLDKYFCGHNNGILFYKDIILSNELPKGEAWWNFLWLVNLDFEYIPSSVIFVDNLAQNVVGMRKEVAKAKSIIGKEINFYGFEYICCNKPPEIDLEKMEYQLIQFFARGEWVNCNDRSWSWREKDSRIILDKLLNPSCSCFVM